MAGMKSEGAAAAAASEKLQSATEKIPAMTLAALSGDHFVTINSDNL